MTETPDDFFTDLGQQVLERAEADDLMLPTAFTLWACDLLVEAGVFTEVIPVDFRRHGLQLDGFALDDDNSTLSLIVTDHASRSTMETWSLTAARAQLKRAVNFHERSIAGLHEEIEESSSAFDAALEINSHHGEVQQVRFVLISDGVLRRPPEPPDIPGVSVSVDVWDADRLHRLASSGRRQEAIRVDLEADFGTVWPCLRAERSDEDAYTVYLALVPGEELARIYDRFGPRLLELNVRSYLQARGKINKGIRRTILEEPGRFLAYNNGITATASKIRMSEDASGRLAIAGIDELQIVNGGQTSASLHRTWSRDRADLTDVVVMAKITVVDDVEQLHELVPLVSRYSNSQNRVSEADFAATDDLHVQVEKLSRTIWAPSPEGGSQLTRWFYERSRGQYNDEIGRIASAAARRRFRDQHPSRQKFTKTDLAKFEHTWQVLPWEVSKGAQKNFMLFQERIKDVYRPTVDDLYFQQLVSKAIMFRRTEQLVSGLHLGGYRANVVTYTLGLLVDWAEHRIDLERIWRCQGLDDTMERTIEAVAPAVFAVIAKPPSAGNVTEWAKKEACWTAVQRQVDRSLVAKKFWDELAASRQDTVLRDGTEVTIRRERGVGDKVKSVLPAAWFAAEIWATSNARVTATEARSLQNAAFAAGGTQTLSRRDAQRADETLLRLIAAGFDHPDLGPYGQGKGQQRPHFGTP